MQNSNLSRGDIVLVPFPFTDLSAARVRPAVIISSNPQGRDVIIAFISSVVPATAGQTEVIITTSDPSFNTTGLRLASVFKLSKLVTIERSLIMRRLGSTTPELQAKLDQALKNALNVS